MEKEVSFMMNSFDNIFVSVIMCEYNTNIMFLNEAIESILNQTHRNFELLIVDDGSFNSAYLDEYAKKDNRIRIIHNSRNKGVSFSRNVGILNSTGQYILMMDSDDISLPNRIKEQISYMELNKQVVAAGSYVQIFGKRNRIQKIKIDNNEVYRASLVFGNYPTIINPSCIIRAKVLKDNNLFYTESLNVAEDYEMWIKLSNIGVVTNIKKVLLKYRIRDNQLSEKYRSTNINDDNWYVINNQLKKIGLNTTKYETILRNNFRSNEVEAFEYYSILLKMIESNNNSKYIDSKVFIKRCKMQWKQKVFAIKSWNLLVNLYKKLDSKGKMQLLFILVSKPFYALRDKLC